MAKRERLRPFGDRGTLPPIEIRHSVRPVIDQDGTLVEMRPAHRCPECGNWIGEGEADCPPGAQLLPFAGQ